MHLEFVELSKHWADMIISRGTENMVAIDLVVAKINSLVRAASSTLLILQK